jgi:hypothetical protein
VDNLLKPKLVNLVDYNEEVLIMGRAPILFTPRRLGRKELIELEVIPIVSRWGDRRRAIT